MIKISWGVPKRKKQKEDTDSIQVSNKKAGHSGYSGMARSVFTRYVLSHNGHITAIEQYASVEEFDFYDIN